MFDLFAEVVIVDCYKKWAVTSYLSAYKKGMLNNLFNVTKMKSLIGKITGKVFFALVTSRKYESAIGVVQSACSSQGS